ncbi:MAG: NUDIX domain-containing protein [Candidatus Aminicenantes bacterium]|nr:NUDIX domain-containing protein [Candidatus Aminicenantes bacterium]
MIPEDLFRRIVEVLPILCVDVVIRDKRGKYLLVKRTHEPLKGEWWVIGGRVWKGEQLADAAARKIREELSLDIAPESLTCLGYYEDVFERNALEIPSGLHTLGVVFGAEIDGRETARLDGQSAGWTYADALPERLLIKPFGRGGSC